jgi:hypothetical protein
MELKIKNYLPRSRPLAVFAWMRVPNILETHFSGRLDITKASSDHKRKETLNIANGFPGS